MDARASAPRDLIELRIHGVSGTPPESMLDAHFATRVAGDQTTGFYRPDPPEVLAACAPAGRTRTLEGYSWRGMTSGSAGQALWLVLAPFALANTAAAMRPPDDGTPAARRAARVHGAVVRVFALTLTLTLVMAAFVAFVDQLAWQCGNQRSCTTAHAATQPLAWGAIDDPARRIAVALLGPVGVITLLWHLARRAWKARATVLAVTDRDGPRDAGGPATASGDAPRAGIPIALDDLAVWHDREPSEYLRHLHVGAALALVSLLAATATAYLTHGPHAQLAAIVVLDTGLLALALIGAIVGWQRPLHRPLRALSVLVLAASGATLVWIALVLLAAPKLRPAGGAALPGVESAIAWLFVFQLVLIGAVFVSSVAPRAANRADGVGLRGAGSGFVAGAALIVGALFSAGTVLRMSDYLGTIAATRRRSSLHAVLVVPRSLTWAARGAVVLAVVVVAVAALALARFTLGALAGWVVRSRHALARFWRDAPAPPAAATEAAARRRALQRAERRAALTDRAATIVLAAGALALGVAVALTVIVVLVDTGRYHPAFDADPHSWVAQHASVYGSWLITAFVVGALAIVVQVRRSESLRRQVGILWDLTTFWPRHAHPLAPPCYTDEALPEMVYRTGWHVEQGLDVIVSAHSQGSVIVGAVVLQLPAETRRHVALLTYGSPLHRLYATWFPHYFAGGALHEMRARLDGRWINLYRTTDPIGGAIRAPDPRANVCIVPRIDVAPGDTAFPPILAHSDYQSEPAFPAAIADLDRRLGDRPA